MMPTNRDMSASSVPDISYEGCQRALGTLALLKLISKCTPYSALNCPPWTTVNPLQSTLQMLRRLIEIGPCVFEINPRFSSTVLMRHRISYTDVLWALSEAEGKSICFPSNLVNKIMVRIQGALVFDGLAGAN